VKPEPLSVQFRVYEGHARGIATGMVEACYKAEANRVSARQKHNWNRRACLLCRNRRGSIPDYDGRVSMYEFGYQSGQVIIVTAGKVVFNRHVLTVDVASLFDTEFERHYKGSGCARCCA
jgi:hypothetical protein